jgi:hypothetical protein
MPLITHSRAKVALVFFLWVFSAMTGHARLGETIRDLKRRYGQPVNVEATKASRTDRYSFAWDRYDVTVTVQEGRSVSEAFTRADRREFTLQEIHALLIENSDPGLAWLQVDGSTWRQQDRTAVWNARSLLVEEKARGK